MREIKHAIICVDVDRLVLFQCISQDNKLGNYNEMHMHEFGSPVSKSNSNEHFDHHFINRVSWFNWIFHMEIGVQNINL